MNTCIKNTELPEHKCIHFELDACRLSLTLGEIVKFNNNGIEYICKVEEMNEETIILKQLYTQMIEERNESNI